jgi:hypothetical protein
MRHLMSNPIGIQAIPKILSPVNLNNIDNIGQIFQKKGKLS